MSKYLKLFETHSEYETYISGQNAVLPNVSYCEDNNEVHYNPLPYQGFCKLTLNDGSTVELEGSGELTQAMVSNQYKNTLVSAEIGELCTSIGDGAFNYCSGLTSITIPDSITSIGDGAFYYCGGLTSITIPNSVTNIGNSAFYYCGGLTSVTIGSGVTSIGNGVFSNCSSLTSITIGSGVTSIGFYAFASCSSLTSITSLAITAPTIDYRTFTDVKTNGTLIVPSESNGYDNWISSNAFYLGYYNWTKVEQVETKLVVYYDIQNISVPTTIFTNYDSSVKSIEVDGKETISEFSQGNVTYQFGTVGQHIIKFEFNNPTTVGNNAPLLNNLTTVKRIVIPNSVTSIGNYAFNSCTSLTSVTIGNSVTSIGTYAFYNCSNLTTITSHIMNAPSVNSGTFSGVKNGGTLYVPIGSSGYETWMNDQGNLGYHNWTKVEQ